MYLIFGIAVLLYIAVLVVLVRSYIHTRNIGFIWLGAYVILGPVVRAHLRGPELRLFLSFSRHQPVNWYPANLVQYGQISPLTFMSGLALIEAGIGVIVLVIAVSYLGRLQVSNSTVTA